MNAGFFEKFINPVPRNVPMESLPSSRQTASQAICILLLCACILCPACADEPPPGHTDAPHSIEKQPPLSECLDITGFVLGDAPEGTVVTLVPVSGTEFTTVMHEIRFRQPVSAATVNRSKGFAFDCIPEGTYAAVIPKAAFTGASGAPLPHESGQGDLSPKIAFHGGDRDYSACAFQVLREDFRNETGPAYPAGE